MLGHQTGILGLTESVIRSAHWVLIAGMFLADLPRRNISRSLGLLVGVYVYYVCSLIRIYFFNPGLLV